MLSANDHKPFLEAQRLWIALQERFSHQPPGSNDLEDIEQFLIALAPARGQHLFIRECSPTDFPIHSVCTADIDGDGQAEVFIAAGNGDVGIWQLSSSPRASPIKASIPIGSNTARVVGLTAYEDPLGGQLVSLVVSEDGNSRVYDLYLDLNALRLDLKPRPYSTSGSLATIAHRVRNPRNVRSVEVIWEKGADGRYRHLVQAQGLRGGAYQGDAQYHSRYHVAAALYDERGILVGGTWTQVLCLAFDQVIDGHLRPDDQWSGYVSSYVTALTTCQLPGGTHEVLVACDDGYLHALDYESGELRWKTSLPDIPVTLALGDVDGDGVDELLVGCENGDLYVCSFAPREEGKPKADREADRAWNWAIEACGGAEALVSRWLQSGDSTLVSLAREMAPAVVSADERQDGPSALESDQDSLIKAWIDVQRGVRHLWTYHASGPLEVLHAFYCPESNTAWALVATRDSQLELLDLGARRMAAHEDLGDKGPIRSIASADVIDASCPELVVAMANGTVRVYEFDRGVELTTPTAVWRAATEAWAVGFTLPNTPERQKEVWVGCDDGWIEGRTFGSEDFAEEPLFFTDYMGLRHLAILGQVSGGVRLAVADNRNLGFSLLSPENPGERIDVPVRHVVRQLLAWPDRDGRTYPVAACADGQVFVFNERGEMMERHWPDVSGSALCPASADERIGGGMRPVADLFDLDSDECPELLVACQGRVVAYDLSGSRVVELCLQERPLQHLQGVFLPSDRGSRRPGLVAATPEGEIHLFEVLDLEDGAIADGAEINNCLKVAAAGGDVVSFLIQGVEGETGSRMEAVALTCLGQVALRGSEVAERIGAFLCKYELPDDSASMSLRVSHTTALVRTMAGSRGSIQAQVAERLKETLMSEHTPPQVWHATLMTLEKTMGAVVDAELSEQWFEVVEVLGACEDRVTRRGVASLAASSLLGGQESKGWWDILRQVTSGEGEPVQIAGEAVALHLRDLYRANPDKDWWTVHRFLDHGMNPGVLHCLASDIPPLMIMDARERKLFDSLAEFMQAGGMWVLQALECVADAVDHVGGWAQREPLAQAYRDFARLSSVSDEEELQSLLDNDLWLIDHLQNVPVEALIPDVADRLGESFHLLRQGLSDYHAASPENRLEQLRHLATAIERKSEDLGVEAERLRRAGKHVSAAWLSCLAALLRSWGRAEGIIGQWIHRLEYEFDWDVHILTTRIREGELRIDFRLENVGFAPGCDVKLDGAVLCLRDQELPCVLVPPMSEPCAVLESNEYMACLIHVPLSDAEPSGESAFAEGEEAHIRFRVSYTQGGRQEKERIVPLVLPRGSGLIYYPHEFPTSWKVYENELRQLLARKRGMVFVELDRSARRSFLEACQNWLPSDRVCILNLRQIYNRARTEYAIGGRPLPVRAQDLCEEMAHNIWGDKHTPHFGPAYRSQFRMLLRTGPRPIETLFLDHFDYLVIRLLEDDGEEQESALSEMLDYWAELAEAGEIQLVLGGAYLTLKILQVRYPEFYARLEVMRPDYLILTDGGRVEVEGFLKRKLRSPDLKGALTLFAQPLTVRQLVDLCGGNLLFLRFFALDGLEQAAQEARTPEGEARLARLAPLDYLLERAERRNFFRMAWVWLPFYEKVALSLIAHAEFAVEEKHWLRDVTDLELSREYRPGLPPDSRGRRRRSRKVEGRPGDKLTPALIQKIRSSRYFNREDVRIAGLASKRPLSIEKERTGIMLLHLLKAVGLDQLLTQFREERVLNRRSGSKELGEVYTFRIPLFRAFFTRNGAFQQMLKAAAGDRGDWYPKELHRDACDPQQQLFERWTEFLSVYRLLPLADLPKINAALRNNAEKQLFLSFYGLAGSSELRQRRWRMAVSLARALERYGGHTTSPSEAEMRQVFGYFNKLLEVQPAQSLPGMEFTGPAWKTFGENGLIWQFTEFDEKTLPGLRKRLLMGIIQGGRRWELNQVEQMRQWARDYLRKAWQAEREYLGEEEEKGEFERGVMVLIALKGDDSLRQRLEDSVPLTDVRFIVLGEADLGEIICDGFPAKKFVRLCQRQVGRAVLSPYKPRGPLEPGSHLFVGRKQELERIVEHVRQTPFIILGSRRIGKTTLLQQVQDRLRSDERYLPLWIGGTKMPRIFLQRVRTALRRTGWEKYAAFVEDENTSYEGLRGALYELRKHSGQLPVLLLDEIDGLYRQDRELGERLFTSLRDFVQEVPPLCGLVMTGYLEIYRRQYDHGSVFFNFGEPVFLREVEKSKLARLVDLLQEYGVELYHRQEATALILEETYQIPYLVQTACDRLLVRLDDRGVPRPHPDRIERGDVEAVLTGHIDEELMKELITNIRIEADDSSTDEEARLRIRILLYAILLDKYPYPQEHDRPFRLLRGSERFFTAHDALRALESWAAQVKPSWPWTYEGIDELLRELCMTLAIGAESLGPETRYYFPQDILPRLLHRWYRSGRRGNILDDLEAAIKAYSQLK